MSFQNLRANSPIYILHKDATPFVEIGTVTNITAPVPNYGKPPLFGTQMEMVVDVTVKAGDQSYNFAKLPVTAEIGDFSGNGNMLIACGREAINSEVASMRQRSMEVIASVDYHQQLVAACDKMLKELNPEVAERERQDAENRALRDELSEVKKMLGKLLAKNGGKE